MKNFGIRDVLDLVAKDPITRKPVFYFENLKMSEVDNKTTTVYAKGGHGNARLIAWTGNREMKVNCEEATLSPVSLGLFMGSLPKKYKKLIHIKEDIEVQPDIENPLKTGSIELKYKPMVDTKHPMFVFTSEPNGKTIKNEFTKALKNGQPTSNEYDIKIEDIPKKSTITLGDSVKPYDVIIVDYYYESLKDMNEIKITVDDFPGSYIWEGSTLVRTEGDNKDHVAKITIPNGKLISDFTMGFKPDGDPSTFKFSIECLKGERGKDFLIMDIEEEAIE